MATTTYTSSTVHPLPSRHLIVGHHRWLPGPLTTYRNDTTHFNDLLSTRLLELLIDTSQSASNLTKLTMVGLFHIHQRKRDTQPSDIGQGRYSTSSTCPS
jgi:hypothetical protein